jgi:hypothetical protein
VAGDLIPPPSPAGRPSPDPERFEPVEPEPVAEAAETRPAGPAPFRGRFGFVAGALAGCAAGAAVLALILATTGPRSEEGRLAANWSEWKPTTNQPFSGAREIAQHIQRGYRNEKRRPLASVSGGPIAVGTIPLVVALPSGDDVEVLDDGLGIQYTLGGSGENGVLEDSTPSKERHRLLRREALELALYSFRYLPDVTMVVTLLPPAPKAEQIQPGGKKAAKPSKDDDGKADKSKFQPQALFYRPGDLLSQLQVPLRHTMSVKAPPIDRLAGDEAQRIDSLTLSNLFEFARRQGQDGRAYLVLERPE